MAGVPRNVGCIFCEGYTWAAKGYIPTDVGHILSQVYLEMLGTNEGHRFIVD